MFDLAWSEIALIGVVALVVIGPKDLPEAIRGVAKGVQKLRRMASEFQSQADELVREAKLDEVRNQINEVKSAVNEFRNFDLRGTIEKHVDGDGTIRSTFEADPLKSATDWTPPPVTEPPSEMMEGARAGMAAEAPAFVPPTEAARILPAAADVGRPPVPEPPAAPAFVPPAEAAPQPMTTAAMPDPPAPAGAFGTGAPPLTGAFGTDAPPLTGAFGNDAPQPAGVFGSHAPSPPLAAPASVPATEKA